MKLKGLVESDQDKKMADHDLMSAIKSKEEQKEKDEEEDKEEEDEEEKEEEEQKEEEIDIDDDKNESFGFIDKILGEYYKMNGIKDYFDENGAGIFSKYIEENGYEEEEIGEELGDDANYEDCVYLDFDDNFPFKKNTKSQIDLEEDEKQEILFNLLRNIVKFGRIAITFSFGLYLFLFLFLFLFISANLIYFIFCAGTMNFDISSVEMNFAYKVYDKQCDLLRMTDNGYMWCLSVGLKNKFPFLQSLVDIYVANTLHQRMSGVLNKKSYTKWFEESKFFTQIVSDSNDKNDETFKEYVISGMCEYFRSYPTLFVKANFRSVGDKIHKLAQYILMSNQVYFYL